MESFVKMDYFWKEIKKEMKKKQKWRLFAIWKISLLLEWTYPRIKSYEKRRFVKCRFAIFYEIRSMFRWWIHAYFATPRALLYARNLLANTFSLSRIYALPYPVRSLLRFQETRCARIRITGCDSLGKAMSRKWIENRDLSTEIR